MTKKKVFISIVGIALLIVSGLVLSTGYAKKGVVLSPKEQAEVESIIRDVIQQDTQKDITTEEELRESFRKDSEDPNLSSRFRKLFKDCLETGDYTKCGTRTVRVETKDITLGEMEKVDGNKINVKVKERRIWHYADNTTGSGIEEYVFTLVKENGKWKFKKFLKIVVGGFWLDSETGELLDLRPDWVKEMDKPIGPSMEETMRTQTVQLWRFGDLTPEEIKDWEELKERFPEMKIEYEKPKELNFQEKDSITALASSYTYNRNNAAWYGSYYALNPNSSFRYFPDGDCTNFISQAVWYGNWPWVGWWPSKSSTSVWWYSFYSWQGQSYTWTSASMWSDFTYSRPRGLKHPDRCTLQLGDIVQQDTDRNGTMNHSMIVTYKSGSCYIEVSYHTPNKKDRVLKEIIDQNPNSDFYFWRLYNSGS